MASSQYQTGIPAQTPFGIQPIVVARCPEGHTSSIYDPPQPYVVLDIEQSAATALQRHYGSDTTITAQHYFQHYVPRNRANNNRPIHTHPTSRPCAHSNCSSPSHIQHVSLAWPQILSCRPQIATKATDDCLYPVNLEWPRTITIEDVEGKGQVTYKLAGFVNHSVDHFTSRIWIGDTLYSYNDMDGDDLGYATLKACNMADTSSSEVPFLYMYVLTSEKATVCHSSQLVSLFF